MQLINYFNQHFETCGEIWVTQFHLHFRFSSNFWGLSFVDIPIVGLESKPSSNFSCWCQIKCTLYRMKPWQATDGISLMLQAFVFSAFRRNDLSWKNNSESFRRFNDKSLRRDSYACRLFVSFRGRGVRWLRECDQFMTSFYHVFAAEKPGWWLNGRTSF